MDKPAILARSDWFTAAHEIHLMVVEGPFLSPEYFAVIFHMDATIKATGHRMQVSEVALYTVATGKVIRDEFLMAS